MEPFEIICERPIDVSSHINASLKRFADGKQVFFDELNSTKKKEARRSVEGRKEKRRKNPY